MHNFAHFPVLLINAWNFCPKLIDDIFWTFFPCCQLRFQLFYHSFIVLVFEFDLFKAFIFLCKLWIQILVMEFESFYQNLLLNQPRLNLLKLMQQHLVPIFPLLSVCLRWWWKIGIFSHWHHRYLYHWEITHFHYCFRRMKNSEHQPIQYW